MLKGRAIHVCRFPAAACAAHPSLLPATCLCVVCRLCHTSYFRTATTKVGVDGWSLHPDLDQQRTVSVREVARSQVRHAWRVPGNRQEGS